MKSVINLFELSVEQSSTMITLLTIFTLSNLLRDSITKFSSL